MLKLLALAVTLAAVVVCEENQLNHYNVILVGATGDLAKKYLWTALFDLFTKHYEKGKTHFSIYACAQSPPDKGRKAITDILLFTIKCTEGDSDCKAVKTKFVEATQYNQLKSEDDYIGLGDKINENTMSLYGTLASRFSYEAGRLIYLAIPPSSYAKTTRLLDYHLRPRVGHPWVRIVLEKPFGTDLNTASELNDKLSRYFKPQEIYLIDHYLGKTVAKSILPFRYVNKDILEGMWNKQHVERVEVVLKESVDVSGHLKYYEESGVVRDMLQSHAMTLFALVGCSLPASSAHIQQILASRQQLLAAVSVVQPQHILLGQYSTFAAEVLEQLQHLVEATVPTFAAAVLSVNTNRWQGVPFVLVSGKKLDKKASYVRVVFRKNLLCISRMKCTDGGEVVFNVGGINSPSIVISKTLGQPVVPSGWKISLEAEDEDNIVLKPIHDVEAYTALLEAVFDGQRHLFADMTSVLASWRIWSDVVSDGTLSYRNYTGGKDGCNMLDFHINGNRPEFLFPLMPEDRFTADIKQLPSEFRSQQLVTGSMLTVKQSAVSWLVSLMQEAVQLRGVCHIALSGGQTIVQVVQLLAEDYSVPWAKVHVWQVDERCVQANDSERNLHILQPLVHVALLPITNLHAMPVHLAGSPCALDDHADAVYEADMKRHIPDGILDIAVLGVGEDGHTASLFPNSEALSVTDRWVAFANSESARTKKRITLTFPTLNRARHLAVIITGTKKRSIVERISTVTDHQAYPITGLKGDDVRWYIDNAALAV